MYYPIFLQELFLFFFLFFDAQPILKNVGLTFRIDFVIVAASPNSADFLEHDLAEIAVAIRTKLKRRTRSTKC